MNDSHALMLEILPHLKIESILYKYLRLNPVLLGRFDKGRGRLLHVDIVGCQPGSLESYFQVMSLDIMGGF